MLYMRLIQMTPKDRIPTSKLEAIELANNVGISNDIRKEIHDIVDRLCAQEPDDGIMSTAIAIKQKEIETELTLSSFENRSLTSAQ